MVNNNITINNAHIFSRNFSGKKGEYNPEGNRNFCVFIDDELMVKTLKEDGWNIRYLKPRDEYEQPRAFLQVKVQFSEDGRRNPKMFIMSHRGKTVIDEKNVNILDWAEIDTLDLVIRPYNWDVKGAKGVKAYLKSLALKVVEDELDLKYQHIPDSAVSAIGGCGNCEACDGSCQNQEDVY